VPPEAVKLTLLPWQKVVAPDAVMVEVGTGVTVMVLELVAVQLPLATVTA
jgi:hypothetical protein